MAQPAGVYQKLVQDVLQAEGDVPVKAPPKRPATSRFEYDGTKSHDEQADDLKRYLMRLTEITDQVRKELRLK
jgi:hypothetical protein